MVVAIFTLQCLQYRDGGGGSHFYTAVPTIQGGSSVYTVVPTIQGGSSFYTVVPTIQGVALFTL